MNLLPRLTIGLCLAGAMLISVRAETAEAEASDDFWVYLGTYTQGESEGIYVAPFDARTGEVGEAKLAAKSTNPSFVALHPSGDYLYAVGETGDFEGKPSGCVHAFSVDRATGSLRHLNTQASGGSGPCHLSVDRAGRAVLVANYGGGSAVSLAIGSDGRLGEMLSLQQHEGSSVNAGRQAAPHAHSINLDHANRFAFVADLGIDQIVGYRYEDGYLRREGAPPSVALAPGSGPRHFAFHPTRAFAYVINELRSTITVFGYDPSSGKLDTRQTISTLPDDYPQPSYTAEVVVHPSGKFVYGSNRGHDSIAVFQVDDETGGLTRVQIQSTQGKTPRNFAVDPTGRFLLAENQDSGSVVTFRIDSDTGKLAPTGSVRNVPMPVCIKFLERPVR